MTCSQLICFSRRENQLKSNWTGESHMSWAISLSQCCYQPPKSITKHEAVGDRLIAFELTQFRVKQSITAIESTLSEALSWVQAYRESNKAKDNFSLPNKRKEIRRSAVLGYLGYLVFSKLEIFPWKAWNRIFCFSLVHSSRWFTYNWRHVLVLAHFWHSSW